MNARLKLQERLGKKPLMKLPKTAPSPFATLSTHVDPSGRLSFGGKTVVHSAGVDFSNGVSYKISFSELETLGELGRGQYGVVQKVRHTPTGVFMAMKEIRLELDPVKLKQILMELDILHQSCSPYIVEFYGAFFIESCVFCCMEFMDAGSLDKLYRGGIQEAVLAKICISMVKGLKFLKDQLSIIHRDVKPTNVLASTKGEIKLCDFGVSGQLIQSLAKTNIGCQSYMAPERISVRDAGTYNVSADVWSLGLSLVEMAFGEYPYPNNRFESVFAQLNAIVTEDPPQLNPALYSEACRDFIRQCLNKNPKERPSYKDLLEHKWIKVYENTPVDVASWAVDRLRNI